MKKLICLVVLVLVAALCLGSCGWIVKWFPRESDGDLTLAAKIDYAPDVILTTDMSVEDLRQYITVVAYCGSLSDASLGKTEVTEVTDYNLLCDIAEGYCDIEIEYQGATFQLKDYFFDKSYIEYDGDFVFYNRIMPMHGPSLVRYIGNDAEVTLPERSPYAVYANAFFGNQTMTVLHLGNSVQDIGSNAFFGCTALKEIYFGNSLNHVYHDAFLGCDSLEKVEAPSLEIWCSIDFAWDGLYFHIMPNKGYLPSEIQFKEYEIKDPIYVIDPQLPKTEDLDYGSDNNSQSDNGSQSDNSSQSLVTVPVYYSGAFYYNGSVYTLHSVYNPLQIAKSLWINGEHITELVIPESVTYIYGDAFRGADITSVEIHSGVTYVGYRAFTSCKELKNVNIYSQDVIYSGTLKNTFDASAMTDYMGGKYLGNEQNPYLVFVSVGNVEEFVEIHEDAVVISSGAFGSGKFAFPSLVIHDGIKKISRSAFSGLSADTELYIGSGVEEIGERAMYSSASASVFNHVVYANNSGWYYIDQDGNEVSFDPCSINNADDEALKYTWYLRSVSED